MSVFENDKSENILVNALNWYKIVFMSCFCDSTFSKKFMKYKININNTKQKIIDMVIQQNNYGCQEYRFYHMYITIIWRLCKV